MLRTEIAGFRGELITPGDEQYDDARRVFNGMIDRYPALIARCTNHNDVVAAVTHAREEEVPLAVYGGGHSVTGHGVCEDGLVVDLRGMKGIKVNPDTRLVRAQAGLTWGEFDAATQQHGLAVTGGRVGSTGIAGFTLGSGSGWLERRHGLACDSLVAAEVVLADGSVVTASEDEDADLFWAIRGGGGNFGVVTRFDFEAHPVGPLWAGMLIFPHERAREVLQAYREFIEAAPDDVGGAPALISAPPEPFVPEPVQGKPVLGVVVVYTGDPADGPEAFKPILDLEPAVALVDTMPYLALQGLMEAANPPGMRNYWTSDFYAELPDAAIDTLVAFTAEVPSPLNEVIVLPSGGAIARVPEHAMAFGERKAKWNLHYLSMWPGAEDDERIIAWTRELSAAMKPYSTGGVYLNFLGDEGQERIATGYGRVKYARLQSLKARYDPDNLFRLNQNIVPA
jgi:FAD/FMN-containing dehydrogenase